MKENDIEYIAQLLEKIEKGLGDIYDFKQKLKETMENIDKRISAYESKIEEIKKNADAKEKLEKMENEMKNIDKKMKEDNKFLESIYIEFKNNIKDTDEKFRETEKEISKIRKEIEKTGKIFKLFNEIMKTMAE